MPKGPTPDRPFSFGMKHQEEENQKNEQEEDRR